MIITKSEYNKKGDLISRITVGKGAFPEKLEIEYNEFGLAQQSLHDLITDEDGKEFKKLKLRTSIIYDNKGRVSKITSPESIVTCEYPNDDEYKIPFIEEPFKVKSISHTEYLIKNEDGSEKNNTVCYSLEGSGTISNKDDPYDINYESVRVLVTYNLDKSTIKFTEYYFFNSNKNVVYYEKRDINDEVKEYQVTVFDINTNDVNYLATKVKSDKVIVTSFDNLYEERKKYPNIFSLYPDNKFCDSVTTVTDATTGKELQRTESTYKFIEVEGDIIVSHEISTNDMENDDADVYTEEEYRFDSDGNLIKLRDNNDHVTSYMKYDTYGNLSRMEEVNIETKKITPFSRTGKVNNKTIHLYSASDFEDKQISTEFVKYPFGYIKETTTVTKDGKELCSYETNNGEDYKVGVLFDALYN
jgi:hypothetical protein